jgi:radical SAM superfamily enzyme YgiQ (UPF0313 family)
MSGSTIDWDYIARSDYVCFSLLSFCSHRGYELMKRVRSVTQAPIICGGSHSSVLDRECLDHGDFVVRNEGESACIELLSALDAGGGVEAVAGISYKADGEVIRTRDRDFVADLSWSADYSLIEGYGSQQSDPVEAWQSGKPWFHFPVSQASRGCPRNCRFCFVRRELGSRYRKRSISAVRQEVEGLARLLRRSANGSALPVLFVDNDFCLDRRFTLACLGELEEATREYKLQYHAFTRIESAQDAGFVRAMSELGVSVLFLGIESINDLTLRLYAKGQRREGISKALKVCRETGMGVLGFFVLGADTDTPDVVRRSVEFAVENELHNIGLFSLYGFPAADGNADTPQLIANHRFIHHDWRFFNSNFVVHFPLNIKPSRLQREIIDGYDAFNAAVEGPIPMRRRVLGTMRSYCDYLEGVEDEFYDRAEHLVERRLLKRSPEAIKRLAL